MNFVKYALRIKGASTPLNIREEVIKTAKGKNVYCMLSDNVGEYWYTDDLNIAIEASKPGVQWYEGTRERPAHEFENLEIIQVTKIETVEVIDPKNPYAKVMDDNYAGNTEENEIAAMSSVLERHLHVREEEKETPEMSKIERIDNEILQYAVKEAEEEVMKITKKEKEDKTIIKMKVMCRQTMHKELGKLMRVNEPKTVLFEKGKEYLGYMKEESIYVINSKNVPEYMGEMPKEKQKGDVLFDKYFEVIDIVQGGEASVKGKVH